MATKSFVRAAAASALTVPALLIGMAFPAQAATTAPATPTADEPGVGDVVSAAEDYVSAEEGTVGEVLTALGGTLG
jgi:hypothetical protein